MYCRNDRVEIDNITINVLRRVEAGLNYCRGDTALSASAYQWKEGNREKKKRELLPNRDEEIKFSMSLPPLLSEKEARLLKELLKGRPLTAIAREKNRGIKTLYSQKYSLYKKLGIKNDILLYRDLIVRGGYPGRKNKRGMKKIPGLYSSAHHQCPSYIAPEVTEASASRK